MKIDEQLLEIRQYENEGYMPVIDYETWRVAILNYCDELLPENITKMQKHDESDEVFVLLQGNCTLFIGEGEEDIIKIYSERMKPLKIYNVKRSTWHTHSLSKDAVVLIVENINTCLQNSPERDLTALQRSLLIM